MTVATDTIRISQALTDDALKRLVTLNRRATKHGIPQVDFTFSEPYGVNENRFDSSSPLYIKGDKVQRMYVDIGFSTAPVRIEGYAPVATYVFTRETPTVYTWPSEQVPSDMLSIDNACEHCGYSRKRTRVFMLRETKTGILKRVGSTCVRDFLGRDPAQLLNQLKLVLELRDMQENAEWRMPRGSKTLDLHEIVALSAATVRTRGYVTRKQAEDRDLMSTSARVSEWDDIRRGVMKEEHYHELPTLLKEDVETANKVIETAINASGRNEYEHNLANIAKSGFFVGREFGLAVSMVSYAQRQWDFENRKATENNDKVNRHLGKVKERITTKATLTMTKLIDSYYGPSTLTKWTAETGESLTWFASNFDDSINEGDTVMLTGTVKKHGEWNGIKETTLTRCKIS